MLRQLGPRAGGPAAPRCLTCPLRLLQQLEVCGAVVQCVCVGGGAVSDGWNVVQGRQCVMGGVH